MPADMPDLAASYRVTFTAPDQPARQQVWRLRRSATELVWDKGEASTDIWRRDAGGIRLDRVLHPQQTTVAYSAGELRTLSLAIGWQPLARLLSDADLAQLHRAAPRTRQATNGLIDCQGRLSGDQVLLRWDSVHQLPLRLQRRHAGGQVLFERTAVYATAPAEWLAADRRAQAYRLIDVADLGDLQDDPAARLAQRLDERLGWRSPGHH